MRSALTPLALVLTLMVGFTTQARAGDADAQRVTEMLSGSWKSASSLASAGGDAVELVMHAAPVQIEGMPYAMYVEQARADAMHAPTRQAIFELYRHKGELRMRTHEFRNQTGFPNTIIGLWAAPDLFPVLERADLIATMDVELSASGTGVRGKSPYPYPTGLGGAVEMTSTLALEAGTLTVEDTGFASDGSVAWGGQPVAFEPFESGVEVKRWEEGLVSIQFAKPEGHEATDGDQVAVNYTGWIRNEDSDVISGWTFDDSTRPGRRPFTLSLPGQVIKGWNEGVPGMTTGTIRQLIIPASMAYGERGRPPTIPAGATLYFRVQCMDIIRPQSAGE